MFISAILIFGFHIKAKELNAEYLDTLLKDICCECVELSFSTCQRHTLQLAQLLVAYFQKKGYAPEKLKGSLNFDPISKMMQKGKDVSAVIATGKELVETLVKALVKNPDAVTVTILQKGSLEIYQVHVAPEDMGKVIGRKGRIANAIRTVVKAGALRENRKVAVDII